MIIRYGYFKLLRVRFALLSLFKYIQNKKNRQITHTHFNMTSLDTGGKNKNKGGRPPNSIWDDISKGEHIGSGKYQATCKYCDFSWSRGEIAKLEGHLANHCSAAPAPVVRTYLTKVLEREDT